MFLLIMSQQPANFEGEEGWPENLWNSLKVESIHKV